MSSHFVDSILVIEIKFELINKLLINGNFNNSSAIEIFLASAKDVISILLSASILFATNFITSGFGVLSAYIL